MGIGPEFIVAQSFWCAWVCRRRGAEKMVHNDTGVKTLASGRAKLQGSSFVKASFMIMFLNQNL